MFTLRGKNVAGVGPQQTPDMPPFWSVYVTVEDAAATSEAVTAAGGTVMVPPMDIFDAGTMAVYQDSVGSFVSCWQPDQHIGSQLVNVPGTFTWNELVDHRPGRRPRLLHDGVRVGRRCGLVR